MRRSARPLSESVEENVAEPALTRVCGRQGGECADGLVGVQMPEGVAPIQFCLTSSSTSSGAPTRPINSSFTFYVNSDRLTEGIVELAEFSSPIFRSGLWAPQPGHPRRVSYTRALISKVSR